MSKIIQVINSMILNRNLIDINITEYPNYYFTYNGIYKWSIWRFNQDSSISLTFFPNESKNTMKYIYDEIQFDSNDIQSITYVSDEYKGKEAIETFEDLYKTIQEKALGVDDIFDDLLNLE